MKISRDGFLPQLEPEGWAEPVLVRVGGAKRIIQQSSFPMQALTMANASISAWATSEWLRGLFLNSALLFAATVTLALGLWMTAYFVAILPGEQAWGQGQGQRSERSPLKRDTEAIRAQLEEVETKLDRDGDHRAVADGGHIATDVTGAIPRCMDCHRLGQRGEHKGSRTIECPECDDILFKQLN